MIKALIIDDEQLARDVIKVYLKDNDQVVIIGECSNGFEGVKAIQELEPEIIFLDIQMPKLTGFEMLELIDHIPVVVFSTAFDEFALKAFEMSAADYLLKPYNKERFNEAVSKAVDKVVSNTTSEKIVGNVLDHNRSSVAEDLDRIVIRIGSKIVILSVDDIEYIEAQDDYVAFHTKGQKYLKQLTMKYLERALSSKKFIRVHRSYIVSIDQIDKLEAYSKDSYLAILKGGTKISVSRSGYSALKAVLNF